MSISSESQKQIFTAMGCGASTSASDGGSKSKSKPLSAGNNLPPVIGAQPVKIEAGKKLGTVASSLRVQAHAFHHVSMS